SARHKDDAKRAQGDDAHLSEEDRQRQDQGGGQGRTDQRHVRSPRGAAATETRSRPGADSLSYASPPESARPIRQAAHYPQPPPRSGEGEKLPPPLGFGEGAGEGFARATPQTGGVRCSTSSRDSHHFAVASASASPHGLPITCTPIGNPSALQPDRNET